MDVVARPARAIATSGSPATVLAYHRDVKPSASAAWACSTILSVDDAPPVSPIRIAALQSFCTSTDMRQWSWSSSRETGLLLVLGDRSGKALAVTHGLQPIERLIQARP